MKYIQQQDLTDCGAACLSMICSHYDMKAIAVKGNKNSIQEAMGQTSYF